MVITALGGGCVVGWLLMLVYQACSFSSVVNVFYIQVVKDHKHMKKKKYMTLKCCLAYISSTSSVLSREALETAIGLSVGVESILSLALDFDFDFSADMRNSELQYHNVC